MRLAHSSDGKLIEATATAPKQAICPHCGGTLTLRGRRPMKNGKVTYYWRHSSNKNRNCTARNRPVG